jgi:hypothetical protein
MSVLRLPGRNRIGLEDPREYAALLLTYGKVRIESINHYD